MKSGNNIQLTSTEMGLLWTTYLNDTLSSCIMKYFGSKVEDARTAKILDYASDISRSHLDILTKLFRSEEFPVPAGFSDEDTNTEAPRLYSDSYFLYYLKQMAKVGLATYSMSYCLSSRSDVREFYRKALEQCVKLDQMTTDELQGKGLYVRPPTIVPPKDVEFVESDKYLSGGFFGFLDKRPLNAIEISHLYANIQANELGKSLLIGFAQTAKSPELRKYFKKGVDISSKHVGIFSDTLKQDHLTAPMSWDSEVTDSTEAPFSDKLMLFHVSLLVAAGAGNYGLAASASPRRDVAADYLRLMAEIGLYAEEGAKLMIGHGWLEEPPQAPNRKQLTRV